MTDTINSPSNSTPSGILADDMGFGKTLSSLALIVACMKDSQRYRHLFEHDIHNFMLDPGEKRLPGGTLIVVTKSRMYQDMNKKNSRLTLHSDTQLES